jgi:transketolase
VRLLGIPGVFAPTGSPEWLLDHFGLNAAGIRAAARDVLRVKLPARTLV